MKALIIFPTYNERENIADIVGEVLRLPHGFDVLVVDDNSPDGTGGIADDLAHEDTRVHVLHRRRKEGLGPAYIAGFRWALDAGGYEAVVCMDADFSHRPSYLALFMEAIGGADVVIGSRYCTGVNVINWPMTRLLISYFANRYSRFVTGLPVHDATGGYRCIRCDVLRALDLSAIRSKGYAFQIELLMRAWAKGFRIREIPIIFYDRTRGESKMSFHIAREAALMVWKLRVLNMLGRL